MTSTMPIYELSKARGGRLYAGGDSAEVLRLISQRRRPGPIERRVFRLIVRRAHETAVHVVLRERDGSVRIESTRIWRAGGSLLEALAQAESTPSPPGSRTVWERLRDPWPHGESPAAEAQQRPRPAATVERPGLFTAADLEEFARWGRFEEAAEHEVISFDSSATTTREGETP